MSLFAEWEWKQRMGNMYRKKGKRKSTRIENKVVEEYLKYLQHWTKEML